MYKSILCSTISYIYMYTQVASASPSVSVITGSYRACAQPNQLTARERAVPAPRTLISLGALFLPQLFRFDREPHPLLKNPYKAFTPPQRRCISQKLWERALSR